MGRFRRRVRAVTPHPPSFSRPIRPPPLYDRPVMCPASDSSVRPTGPHIGQLKPEPLPLPEETERYLRVLIHTRNVGARLTKALAVEGDALHAGEMAAMTSMLNSMIGLADFIAASINNRNLRESLHGVRRDTRATSDEDGQMQLL